MGAREKLSKITADWLLSDECMLIALCTHDLVPNPYMAVPMRTGKGRIEYHPEKIEAMPIDKVETLLRIEVLRILLAHPYGRKPYGAQQMLLSLASDLAIGGNVEDLAMRELTASPSRCHLEEHLSMEEYYDLIGGNADEMLARLSVSGDGKPNGEGNDALAWLEAKSALWEEDELMRDRVEEVIGNISNGPGWGSLPGGMVARIKANMEVQLSYRRVMNLFKSSVLSVNRRLTRMRPSRRYGFEQMGSRYPYATCLLVAVDTSGSVDDRVLQRFLGIVNRLFKQGVERIDLVQFDAKVQGSPMSLLKAKSECVFTGRGGTDFQAPIDFCVEHKEYDGLMILTDGIAPMPDMSKMGRRKVLWAINSKSNYQDFILRNGKEPYVCYVMAASSSRIR